MRAKLIQYHGNNRATYECHCGHIFRSTVMPKAPTGKVPSEDICAKFAAYWTRTGVNIDCPKCGPCRQSPSARGRVARGAAGSVRNARNDSRQGSG